MIVSNLVSRIREDIETLRYKPQSYNPYNYPGHVFDHNTRLELHGILEQEGYRFNEHSEEGHRVIKLEDRFPYEKTDRPSIRTVDPILVELNEVVDAIYKARGELTRVWGDRIKLRVGHPIRRKELLRHYDEAVRKYVECARRLDQTFRRYFGSDIKLSPPEEIDRTPYTLRDFLGDAAHLHR